MDIGNQQRVIIVELEKQQVVEPTAELVDVPTAEEIELAAAWPLPLDFDPERVN